MHNWYQKSFWDNQEDKLNLLLSKTNKDTDSFLEIFSNVYSLIDDAWLDAYIRYCRDSSNELSQNELEYIEVNVIPRFENSFADLKKRFLKNFGTNEKYSRVANTFKASLEPYSSKNKELNKAERELVRAHQEATNKIKVDYQGGISTWQAWRYISASKHQAERKAIYTKLMAARYEHAHEISDIYASLIPLRNKQAKNSGFKSYSDYAWMLRQRSDYSYEESLEWSQGLAETFKSSYERLADKLKVIHGIKTVCAWDLPPEVESSEVISEENYKAAIFSAFDAIDSEFGDIVRSIDKAGDMDIMHHENKSGGNFGYGFKLGGRVGISGNTVGTISDMPVLLHECGHAIHFLYTTEQKLSWNQEVSSEISEFIAYLFQCLASDHLSQIGFIPSDKAKQYKLIIADRILHTFRGVAERDLFEKAIYASSPEPNALAFGDIYLAAHIAPPFEELEDYLEYYWQTYPTIVSQPFSGIEYSLAWLCTLLVLDVFRKEKASLIPKLKELMKAGNSLSMNESLKLLGITMPFTKADFEQARLSFEREFLS